MLAKVEEGDEYISRPSTPYSAGVFLQTWCCFYQADMVLLLHKIAPSDTSSMSSDIMTINSIYLFLAFLLSLWSSIRQPCPRIRIASDCQRTYHSYACKSKTVHPVLLLPSCPQSAKHFAQHGVLLAIITVSSSPSVVRC